MDSTGITDKRTASARQLSQEEIAGAPQRKKSAFGRYTCRTCLHNVAGELYVCKNKSCLVGTCHDCLKKQLQDYRNRCSWCSFVIPLSLRCQLADCHRLNEIEPKGLLTKSEQALFTVIDKCEYIAGVDEKNVDMTSEESSALYLRRLLNQLDDSSASYAITSFYFDKLMALGVNPNCSFNLEEPRCDRTLLEDYIRRGEDEAAFKRVKLLIEDGQANPDHFINNPPLTYAIKYQNIRLLDLLLEHGASFDLADEYGLFPIHYARNPSMANKLLAHAPDKGQVDKLSSDGLTPLMHHCQAGHFIMAYYWLNKGATTEGTTHSGEDIFSLIFSNLKNEKKNLSCVATRFMGRLLEQDFPADSLKKLLILCAGSDYFNRPVMATTIIEGLKKKGQLGLVLDSGALACAVANKDFPLAQLLVKEGFDPQATYNGKTAADYAQEQQKDVFIELLTPETKDKQQAQSVS